MRLKDLPIKKTVVSLLALFGMAVGSSAQDMTATPLTFEAVEDGTITVNLDEGWTPENIQYQLNGGNWTDVTWGTAIDLAKDDVISFRGDNGTCYATDEINYWSGFHFEPSNPCYVYGNMMSLIDKDGFATNTTLTGSYNFFRLFQRSDYEPNTAIQNHPTKDIVLPATTLAPYCYDGLFADAPNISRAPELPATTLAEWCYSEMFYGTAITTAPTLPATTLAEACYADMFMNCTNLTTAPDLPATTLAEGCYASMFAGCTSLNYVKCLATDISADYCTTNWLGDVAATGTFVKASSMSSWTVGPDTDDNVNGIPSDWTVENYSDAFDPYTTPLTLEAITEGDITFSIVYNNEHPVILTPIEYQINGGEWTAYSSWPADNSAITSSTGNWPVTFGDAIHVAAGDKVAFRGNNASYFGNGKGYESRINSTASVYVYGNVMSLINSSDYSTLTTLTGKDAFSHLFAVAGENPWEVVPNTTIKSHPTKDLVLPATTLTNQCYQNMFSGCQGLTRAPELPATDMPVACYASMFEGCTSLTVAPALPTTTFNPYGYNETTSEEYGSIDCYMMMFKDCTSLTEAPELPATVLVHGVYQNMFQGCTSLVKAPDLLAPVVADFAYSYMFDGCTSLNYVKCLATDFEINPEFNNTKEDNISNWLNNVAASGTFVKSKMVDYSTGGSGIPAGWTKTGADGSTDTETVTANSDGEATPTYWATFYRENVPCKADANTTVYTAKVSADESKLDLTEVGDKIIPAGNAVILKSTAANITMTYDGSASGTLSNNDLQGSYSSISTISDTYMLVKGGNGVGFYHWTGETIPGHRAYLVLTPSSSSRSFFGIGDGENGTTSIEGVAADGDEGQLYDLTGRIVNGQPRPGIYVRNGKKLIIK